jgi:transcriptional regulator with PAS, ATPase and Fis domain
MARLDVRVKTEIPAFISNHRGEREEKVTVRELSLSGFLMNGGAPKINGTMYIRMALPKEDEVELFGECVRVHNSDLAISFCFPEHMTMLKLWKFIKSKIDYLTICPYCNSENKSRSEYCEKCGWLMQFEDQNYLDRHIQETFLQRISTRFNKLSADYLQRVLFRIDREVLAEKGMSLDEQFVGTSKVMLELFPLIRKFAITDGPVLILGETGTGKDITAKAIHERSERRSGPFVVINCAAIPEGLLESELLGYEKGAFTGAYMSRKGKFELAHNGTVFLDEIAELPLPLQAKLLRILEDKTVERLGSKNGRKVNVRVITATSKDLEQEVTNGRFRIDLFHRINTFMINLPPLRDRAEDKIVIAKYYLAKFCTQERVSKQLSKKAVDAIVMYSWPGNVRELINKIRRAIVVSQSAIITPSDLSIEIAEEKNTGMKGNARSGIEKNQLIETLQVTSQNVSRAARLLGVSRPTLYSLMKKYNLNIPQS